MTGLSLYQLGSFGPVYGPPPGPSDAALPGVVILHGSEGPMAGWAHRFAAILAAHGMLALPLGYGEGDFWSAGPIREQPLARVIEAGRALAAEPRTGRVGLLGWSKGGEMAMAVASLMGADTPFACVAAHAPTDTITGAFEK